MADYDPNDMRDLDVPEKAVEDLKEQDRKLANYHAGKFQPNRPGGKPPHRLNDDRKQIARATTGFQMQPWSGKSDRQILLDAGYSEKAANMPLLKKSITNSPHFTREMAKRGIGPTKVASIVSDGLDAEVPLIRRGKPVVDENGDHIMVKDHPTRLKYLEMVAKVQGAGHESVPQKGDQVNPVLLVAVQRIQNMTIEQKEQVANGDLSFMQTDPEGGE